MELQTIIVSKRNYDLEGATRIAKKYGRVYTHRETSASFRFRQRPPGDFIEGSFRTKKINEDVSLVYGELKEE